MKPTEPFNVILRNNSLQVMIYALPCSASLFSSQNIFYYIYNLETHFYFINIVSRALPFFSNTLTEYITIFYASFSLPEQRDLTAKTQNIHINTFVDKKCNVSFLCFLFAFLCPSCFLLLFNLFFSFPPHEKTHFVSAYLPSPIPFSLLFHKDTNTTTATFFKKEE